MRITVQLSAETHSALQRRAEIMRRPVGWVAREVIETWLRQDAWLPGRADGELGKADVSADDLLGPPTAAEWEAKLAAESGVNSVMRGGAKPQRLAAARAALSGAKERRGFETRVVGPSRMELRVPIPGESYVDEND